MIAAAGLLAARCPGEAVYREWYGRAWAYCEEHFVDCERGGWYPMLSADNARVDPHMPACMRGKGGPAVKSYPSKTDYHPLAACYEVLQVMSKIS
jgi:mannose/cellobiose epimerase-like protein (N-acyl-D-glucosamine 2-epimerase family)